MKNLILLAVCCSCLLSASLAFAGSNRAEFGLGLMVGQPTGLSAKAWTSASQAFDFGLAWTTGNRDGLTMQADYVRHRFGRIEVQEGALPYYYGIGVRLRDREDDDSNLGVRFPVGLDYLFANDPIDVFVEIAPILDLTPDSDVDINATVGARYFF